MSNETKKPSGKKRLILIPVLCVFLLAAAAAVFLPGLIGQEEVKPVAGADPLGIATFPNVYESLAAGAFAPAQICVLSVPKVYEIPVDALVAPEPNQDCYGSTDDPGTLQWLLDEAADILDGQDTLFRTDVELYPGSRVYYYLDETILAIVWKEVYDNFVYTIAEIKVAHPSQFRRYLADNEYDSKPLYVTSKMSEMVNAVVASSGDYYRGRKHGITVYEGTVHRFYAADAIDTCFVDVNGDLILAPRGTFETKEEVQQFVDENQISFSLAFGPILVDNGERCEPDNYVLGEVNGTYPRAALCQRDELHYAVVVANGDGPYWEYPTIHTFAKWISSMGFEKAYSMDGGQTGVITINDQVINRVQFGSQRAISDMIYFATALPEEE